MKLFKFFIIIFIRTYLIFVLYLLSALIQLAQCDKSYTYYLKLKISLFVPDEFVIVEISPTIFFLVITYHVS